MNDIAREELEKIRIANNGFLHPKSVLDFARNKSTELHKFFEWDDNEAAEKYRIAQARALIRVNVIVSPQTNEKVRAYVSLSTDRKNEGGYRALVDIVNDEVMLDTLVADAMKELAFVTKKYESLKKIAEIGELFETIENTVRQVTQSENLISA